MVAAPPPFYEPPAGRTGGGGEGAHSHFPLVGTLSPETDAAARRRSRAGGGMVGGGASRGSWSAPDEGGGGEGGGGGGGGGGEVLGQIGEEWGANPNASMKAPPEPRNKNTWHVLSFSQVAPMQVRYMGLFWVIWVSFGVIWVAIAPMQERFLVYTFG